MKNKLKNIYIGIIWVIALCACVVIWPMGKMTQQETEQTGVEYNHLTEPLSNGVYAVQPFVAKEKFLQSIIVMIDKNDMTSEDGDFQLQLLEESGTVLETVTVPIKDCSSYTNVIFEVNSAVTQGNTYQYSLQALNTQGDGPKAVYRVKNRAGIENLGNLSYFGTAELPDAVSMVRLVYEKPLLWYQIAIYDGFFLLLAALLTSSKIQSIVFRK